MPTLSPLRTLVGAVICVTGLACDIPSCVDDAAAPTPGPAPAELIKGALELPEHPGISGATITSGGEVVLVAERRSDLVFLATTGAAAQLTLPLGALPAGRDLEAITALSAGHYLLGTEAAEDDRGSDDLYRVAMSGGAFKVVETWPFSYAPWGLKAESNKGIEGLCASGGWVLAAAETSFTEGAQRFAPLGLRRDTGGDWLAFDLALTSQTGKISALACQLQSEQTLRAWAIERHFGVSRILEFDIPLAPPSLEAGRPVVSPRVRVDLATQGGEIPNFEGLVRLGDGRFWLISDNDYGGPSGPAVTWSVRAP